MEVTKENIDIVYALFLMYHQYCNGEKGIGGHLCMSPGEKTEEILDNFGLFEGQFLIDYETFDKKYSHLWSN